MKSGYFQGPKPRLMAHRGASAHHPENTLAAFKAAAPHTPYFELDVWATRDGSIVVHHDESLQRTCGVRQAVHEIDWNALQKLDAGKGQKVPALRDIIQAFPGHFYNIEIKQEAPKTVEAVIKLLHDTGAAERTLLAAEHDKIMQMIRSFDSNIATSLSTGEILQFTQWILKGANTPYSTQARAIQIPTEHGEHTLADARLIRAAHAVGMEVHYWTINDAETMQRLWDLGADGIFSDDPALLAQYAPKK